MNPISVIHCADLHLGSEFHALGRKKRTRQEDLLRTFQKIVGRCKEEQIDLLLIAGDLFDSYQIPVEIFEMVQQSFASIPHTKVVVSPGNHDPLTADSPYLKEESWSDNVLIFPSTFTSFVLDELEVELWGAGFPSSYVTHPLMGSFSPTKPDYLQIGVLHGTLGSNAQYNPIPPESISRSPLHYLALGHIHIPSGIQEAGRTLYAYPGCPEGRGFDELGPRGVLKGTLSKVQNTLEFLSLSQRMYLEVSVDISGCTTPHQVAERILGELSQSYGEDYEQHLYKIFLTGKIGEEIVLPEDSIKSLLDSLFYVKLRDKTQIDLDLEKIAKESSLKGIFVRKLRDRMEEDNSPLLEEALKLGLQSFYGEVSYHED